MSIASQYEALRTGCTIAPVDWSSALVVADQDRERFLQGLTTCDVGAVGPGAGAYGFFCDVKGHILSDVVIRALKEHIWLELPSLTGELIEGHLQRYLVADRVTIERQTERAALLLAGQRAASVLEDLSDVSALLDARWGHSETEILGEPLAVALEHRFGVPAYSLWFESDRATALTALLEEAFGDHDVVPVSSEALELTRVDAGWPRFGSDFDVDNLPQETGVEEAVSFEKGCYLGQEVVARLHYRGQEARRVVALRGTPVSLPEVGSRVLLEGRETGRITSVARRPGGEEVFVLAMLQRRAFESGTEVELPDGQVLRVV